MDLLWVDTNIQKASVSPCFALAISSVSAEGTMTLRLKFDASPVAAVGEHREKS